ncbi:MAG: class I SAM-dependent methyltransferase [Candidatus Berkelbacteria bacterium]|nr:class I SAM-dependent methyltransferase [Candidatus Berkelbacteria bacterium]
MSRLPARQFSDAEAKDWRQSIFDIYARMKKKTDKPYEVNYGGLDLTVFPSVYAPEFFDDSLWYAKELAEIVGNKSLLEIGTGTGVIAIICALRGGAKVTATDINPAAVHNATINAGRYKLPIVVKQGDVYSPLTSDEKFDYIFWAHPFNDWDIKVNDSLLLTGIDPRYESLKKYITEAREHLRAGGKLLLGTGDTANLEHVNTIAKKNGYTLNLLRESDRPLEVDGEKHIKDIIYEFTE